MTESRSWTGHWHQESDQTGGCQEYGYRVTCGRNRIQVSGIRIPISTNKAIPTDDQETISMIMIMINNDSQTNMT